MKIIKGKNYNPGNKIALPNEKIIESIKFNVFKFNNKIKPDPNQQVIANCLSEFGCEIVGLLYNLPRVRQTYPGNYLIAIGWYGREYLYRHLVDEYWEIKEEYQWLRDYCRAFHHDSRNLHKLERLMSKKCKFFISCRQMGQLAVSARCNVCRYFWGTNHFVHNCMKCGSPDVQQSLFGDSNEWKKTAIKVPTPSANSLLKAKSYIGNNCVGIFARNRKTYGRNLDPQFYVDLIKLLESMNYSVIWLGEKQNTMPCPVEHVLDFSRMKESRDLELTLSIIKQLKFTIQFWTASTRLSSLVNTPYILFESPDQIWGNGQEGYRRNLCDFGNSKLVASHYLEVKENPARALSLIKDVILEVENENFEDVIGMVTEPDRVQKLKNSYNKRINYGS